MALTLLPLTGDTYVIPSASNVGLWVSDGRATLIDSGNDEDAGRQILKLITERGWTLDLIVNTHSNADHIGGNAFLQKKTGCMIAATAVEASFIEHPSLEPAMLYGGYPMRTLRNKFLLAKASTVSDRIAPDEPILNTPLQGIGLPGHFLGMIGVRTPDDVLFLADSLFSEGIIAKYPIFFLYDVALHLHTLDGLKTTRAAWYVPSHAAPATDIQDLIEVNQRRVMQTLSLIEQTCLEPAPFDTVLERVCDACGIVLDMNQYVLVGSAIRSMLSYLVDNKRIETRFSGTSLLWACPSPA